MSRTMREEHPPDGRGRRQLLRRLTAPLLVAVTVGVATFLALTLGMQQVAGSDAADFDDGRGYVPGLVHDPPRTVKTTDDYGPVGPVSMVFPDDDVESGLTGTLRPAWIAISSQTGDYRAIVAPHLPPPDRGAMAVAPDGRALAWTYGDEVVLYDPVDDSAREVQLDAGASLSVGSFSPDGGLLTVYGGEALHVVDIATGEVASELPDVDARAARQAIWTPDGEGLTYVDRGRLIIRPWRGGALQHTPTGIAPDASLAWHPSGERLAATERTETGNRVQLLDLRADGSLRPGGTVSRESYSLQRMLGFSSETTVSGIGLGLETGPLPQLYRMSTESPVATNVAQLPPDPRVVRTMALAANPMRNGGAPFPEPDWPVSAMAKLVISILGGVFVLGLMFTRRPRNR